MGFVGVAFSKDFVPWIYGGMFGPGRVVEERRVFLFRGNEFKIQDLVSGKWRFALAGAREKILLPRGSVLEGREGGALEVVMLGRDIHSGLEVFLYEPGKIPLSTAARLRLTLLSAGPPGKERGRVSFRALPSGGFRVLVRCPGFCDESS